MSTVEKKVIALTDCDLLQEVGADELLVEFRKLYRQEQAHKNAIADIKKDRDAIGEQLIDLIGAAEVDTVTHRIDEELCRYTPVIGNPNATSLDKKKLARALVTVGKLSKETADAVIKAGSKPASRGSYIRFSIEGEEEEKVEE